MLVAPDSAYVVHVQLHWVVPDCPLEGVDGVDTKDVLVGDSKWQDLRVGISIFCGNSHMRSTEPKVGMTSFDHRMAVLSTTVIPGSGAS